MLRSSFERHEATMSTPHKLMLSQTGPQGHQLNGTKKGYVSSSWTARAPARLSQERTLEITLEHALEIQNTCVQTKAGKMHTDTNSLRSNMLRNKTCTHGMVCS